MLVRLIVHRNKVALNHPVFKLKKKKVLKLSKFLLNLLKFRILDIFEHSYDNA